MTATPSTFLFHRNESSALNFTFFRLFSSVQSLAGLVLDCQSDNEVDVGRTNVGPYTVRKGADDVPRREAANEVYAVTPRADVAEHSDESPFTALSSHRRSRCSGVHSKAHDLLTESVRLLVPAPRVSVQVQVQLDGIDRRYLLRHREGREACPAPLA